MRTRIACVREPGTGEPGAGSRGGLVMDGIGDPALPAQNSLHRGTGDTFLLA